MKSSVHDTCQAMKFMASYNLCKKETRNYHEMAQTDLFGKHVHEVGRFCSVISFLHTTSSSDTSGVELLK